MSGVTDGLGTRPASPRRPNAAWQAPKRIKVALPQLPRPYDIRPHLAMLRATPGAAMSEAGRNIAGYKIAQP